jgi:hypothetical protein
LGVWARLEAEFNEESRQHTQSYINLGWKLSDALGFQLTLDYLNKRVAVDSWDMAENLDQFGVGLGLSSRLSNLFNFSGQLLHYETRGKIFGIIYMDEESVDGWYKHYSILGGVRGGLFNEANLGLEYTHPKNRLGCQLSLSQIWRSYEKMLGYEEEDEQTGAGWTELTLYDLFIKGLNFAASYREEFSSDSRRAWSVSLARRWKSIHINLQYEELANDLIPSDKRVMLTLNLPCDVLLSTNTQDNPEEKESGQELVHQTKLPQTTTFVAKWLKTPVRGMGQPALKVAQEVKGRVDLVSINLADVTSISGPNPIDCGETATYSANVNQENIGVITEYEWKIAGQANIVGPTTEETVEVQADIASGSFTLSLRVRLAYGDWSEWIERTVTLNQKGNRGFVIDCITPTAGFWTGLPAKGTTHTWYGNTGVGNSVNYECYSINFEGDIDKMPDEIPVTVTWTKDSETLDFRWGSGGSSSSSETFQVPKTGGTIGNGGTIVDVGAVRPNMQRVPTGIAGTVTFESPWINTLTLTATRE